MHRRVGLTTISSFVVRDLFLAMGSASSVAISDPLKFATRVQHSEGQDTHVVSSRRYDYIIVGGGSYRYRVSCATCLTFQFRFSRLRACSSSV